MTGHSSESLQQTWDSLNGDLSPQTMDLSTSALNQARDAVYAAKSGCLRAIFYDLVARCINYSDEADPSMSERARRWTRIVLSFEHDHSADLIGWREVC